MTGYSARLYRCGHAEGLAEGEAAADWRWIETLEPAKEHLLGDPFDLVDPDTGATVTYAACLVCGFVRRVA